MKRKPKSIDDYLANLDDDKRTALEKLRKDIKAAVPKAEECISYELPAFRLGGRFLVAFGAAAKHCAFYPGAAAIAAHMAALKPYGLSKGTIRYSADKPLSSALVRKLVRTRIDESAG